MVEAWPKKRIGDILDFKNGLNKGKAFFGHGTPIVNYMDVYHHSGLSASDINGKVSLSPLEISRYEVKKNDVFFTRTSETPEEVGIASVLLDDIKDCVFSGFVLRGRPKNNCLSPNYCKYCFSTKAVRDEIIRHCTYTTRALTNGKQLSAIEIPVPSLPEQKAIAEAITAFDTHISNLSALIEKKRAVRDGSLEDLMSGRTRLEGFSGEWDNRKLSDCVDMYQGGTPRTTNPEYWDGDITWITPGEITKLRTLFVSDSQRKITETGLSCSSAKLMPEGSILLCTRATIGELAIAAKPMATNQGFKNLVCRDGIYNIYFAYLLMTLNQKMLQRAIGTTFLEISKAELGDIDVPAPSFPEQQAIASVLTAMDEEITALEAERDKYAQIREGVMDDLLTGRVRLNV